MSIVKLRCVGLFIVKLRFAKLDLLLLSSCASLNLTIVVGCATLKLTILFWLLPQKKSVFEVGYFWVALFGEYDGDDVEADFAFDFVFFDVGTRDAFHVLTFIAVHSDFRITVLGLAPRLHFHKHYLLFVLRNNVDFCITYPVISLQYHKTLTQQILLCQTLSTYPEIIVFRHSQYMMS